MTEYKCGHKSETILMNDSVLGLATYLEWKDTCGYDGDKSKCFECYCRDLRKEEMLDKLEEVEKNDANK